MAEYKNPILDAMIAIKSGNFDKRFNTFLYPINRWNSGNDKHGNLMNFDASFYINKYLFIVPQKMIMSYMYYSYKMHKDFRSGKPCLWLRYPKKSDKEKTEKRDVVFKYLQEIYNWSDNECKKNVELVDYYIEDDKFISWLDNYVGFEKKEKKLFGIKCSLKVKTNKVKQIVIENNKRSLLDF